MFEKLQHSILQLWRCGLLEIDHHGQEVQEQLSFISRCETLGDVHWRLELVVLVGDLFGIQETLDVSARNIVVNYVCDQLIFVGIPEPHPYTFTCRGCCALAKISVILHPVSQITGNQWMLTGVQNDEHFAIFVQ